MSGAPSASDLVCDSCGDSRAESGPLSLASLKPTHLSNSHPSSKQKGLCTSIPSNDARDWGNDLLQDGSMVHHPNQEMLESANADEVGL